MRFERKALTKCSKVGAGIKHCILNTRPYPSAARVGLGDRWGLEASPLPVPKAQCIARRHADESATTAIALNAALAKSVCDFYTLQGHAQANCYKYKAAQQQAKQQSKHCTKKGKKQE